ncbi:MAG: methionyl-tRNA formyltransferase [Butyrivibrio sp.]|nr:methionyl-tRNA formyltransferase [Butyrivibrio sp.]
MKIVYMGTPDFAVGALEALIAAGNEIAEVVTQPDKPKGRNKEMAVSPVKQCALEHGIPVFQPVRIKTPEAVAHMKMIDADIYVVAAFGQILSQEILDIPRFGCVNIHASLLPEYRGAAPIQQVLLDGKEQTGVTIMQMDAGCDTGDILMQEKLKITEEDTAGTLFDRLSVLGAQLIVRALPQIEAGTLHPVKQDNSRSTSTGKLSKEMGHISWDKGARELVHLIQATSPWPSAYTRLDGKILKIWKAQADEIQADGLPGSVSEVTPEEMIINTGRNRLIVKEVQLEGKRRMAVSEFLRGNHIEKGMMLGQE